jgi:hypothetical protein
MQITIPSILFENACPSIQYRLRKEILHEPPETPAMRNLQEEILQDKIVRKILSWQQPNGWLGTSFHSETGAETAIRLLAEKGIERSYPVLAGALHALEENPSLCYGGIGLPGRALDESSLGGAYLIRAVTAAYAGLETHAFIQQEIQNTLGVIRKAVEVKTVEDLYEIYRAKKVYRKGVYWPSIYHLRLLAFTQTWRNPQNLALVTAMIQKLVDFSPIPPILFRYRSQLVAPASFGMDNFVPDLTSLGDNQWMVWFHRMEVLARLGVTRYVPGIFSQAEALEELLKESDGLFIKPLSHYYFQKWSAYSGLMLEQDWKSSQRRINDLTFRSLLILHYAGLFT